MKVSEIQVSAGRTVPHPIEGYANLRSEIVMKAQLEDGDDAKACINQLQRQAERLVEEHVQVLKNSILEIQMRERDVQRIASLERSIGQQQSELEETKKRTDANKQLLLLDEEV